MIQLPCELGRVVFGAKAVRKRWITCNLSRFLITVSGLWIGVKILAVCQSEWSLIKTLKVHLVSWSHRRFYRSLVSWMIQMFEKHLHNQRFRICCGVTKICYALTYRVLACSGTVRERLGVGEAKNSDSITCWSSNSTPPKLFVIILALELTN